MYSTVNIANNTVINLNGDRWYVNVKSLYYTPKTNIIVYANHM